MLSLKSILKIWGVKKKEPKESKIEARFREIVEQHRSLRDRMRQMPMHEAAGHMLAAEETTGMSRRYSPVAPGQRARDRQLDSTDALAFSMSAMESQASRMAGGGLVSSGAHVLEAQLESQADRVVQDRPASTARPVVGVLADGPHAGSPVYMNDRGQIELPPGVQAPSNTTGTVRIIPLTHSEYLQRLEAVRQVTAIRRTRERYYGDEPLPRGFGTIREMQQRVMEAQQAARSAPPAVAPPPLPEPPAATNAIPFPTGKRKILRKKKPLI